MKTTNQIKNWFAGFRKGRGLEGLSRLAGNLNDSLRIERLIPIPTKRLVLVEFAPAVQFNPRLNFRRPELDSLKDSGALPRMQLLPSAKRRVAT